MLSGTTELMLGVPVALAGAQTVACANAVHDWHSALLLVTGDSPVAVAVSGSEKSCRRLAQGVFSVDPDQVDESMICDALGEVANMMAGQIKIAMKLMEAPLTLPNVVSEPLPPGEWVRCLFNEAVGGAAQPGAVPLQVVVSISTSPETLEVLSHA